MMLDLTPRDLRTMLGRLWAKFTVSEGCWEWTGAIVRSGYSSIGFKDKMLSAHRVMYEVYVGPIPDGLELDHLCKNKRCVRPSHLEPVTHQENMLRGPGIAATNAAKTHCSQGHPFDAENTKVVTKADGLQFRRCMTCKRERNADRKRRMREAKRAGL